MNDYVLGERLDGVGVHQHLPYLALKDRYRGH
jgi:hypothetical protein